MGAGDRRRKLSDLRRIGLAGDEIRRAGPRPYGYVQNVTIADPLSCRCGEVLKGIIKPWQCGVFGAGCTPEVPLGALMVSSEGACAAYYQYGGLNRKKRQVSV
jgi:hydrogenase expression/formation protein HypD